METTISEARDRLLKLINTIEDKREKNIMLHYFGYKGKIKSMQMIADIYSISRQRIGEIINKNKGELNLL